MDYFAARYNSHHCLTGTASPINLFGPAHDRLPVVNRTTDTGGRVVLPLTNHRLRHASGAQPQQQHPEPPKHQAALAENPMQARSSARLFLPLP